MSVLVLVFTSIFGQFWPSFGYVLFLFREIGRAKAWKAKKTPPEGLRDAPTAEKNSPENFGTPPGRQRESISVYGARPQGRGQRPGVPRGGVVKHSFRPETAVLLCKYHSSQVCVLNGSAEERNYRR